MKNTILLLTAAALTLGEISCKKDDKQSGTPIDTYSTLSAKINGVSWAPGIYARYQDDNANRFGLSVATDSNNMWIYGMGLGYANLMVGAQTIHPTHGASAAICSALFSDGLADEVYDNFDVIEADSASNKFIIDSYDANAKIVTGRFHVSFHRIGDLSKPALYGFPDTLRITDGTFNLKIHEYQNH